MNCPSKTLLYFIWQSIRRQSLGFSVFFILSFVWALDATVWPYVLRLVIDVFTQYDADRLAAWKDLKLPLIFGASLWIFVELAFRTRDFIWAKIFPKLEANIRMEMFSHIQRHSPKYFNEHFSGSLSNKISDMVTNVSEIVINQIIFIPTLFACIAAILFFYKIHPLFSLLLACWIAIHFLVVFCSIPRCLNSFTKHAEARSSLVGKIVDSLTNNFTVNLFFRFRFEMERILPAQKEEEKKNSEALMCTMRLFRYSSIFFLIGGLSLNALMISYWMRSIISTGETIQIFTTMWNLIVMIWYTTDKLPNFFQSIGIARQAFQVMLDPQDITDPPHAKKLQVTAGAITFENVSFHYGEKKLFSNKDVQIKGGEKVGLVGYSGAGKSTFVNLILRFYSVGEGRILIDGQDIANVTLESLRAHVTLIPQDPILFHRTLRENIQYGSLNASEQELIAAATEAHCDAFIEHSPKGYDSLVGERGTKLSGGERQRIAIARAILTASTILILDEATSALDSVTERYIQESLDKAMENRTTLVIAHRLSTLSKMNRILVFNKGKIVEQGSHEELLSSGGHYARMWQMQAGGFLPESQPNKLKL